MLEWIPKADNNDEPFFGVDRTFAPVAKEGCCAEVPLGYIPSIQEMLSFPRHRPTGPRCWARQNGGRCRLPEGYVGDMDDDELFIQPDKPDVCVSLARCPSPEVRCD